MALWLEGHMANRILIALQSLISCFLEPPANRRVAVGTIEGPLQELLPSVSQSSTVCCALVAIAQAGEGPLSLISLVPRIRPMKIVGTGQVFSRFSSRL